MFIDIFPLLFYNLIYIISLPCNMFNFLSMYESGIFNKKVYRTVKSHNFSMLHWGKKNYLTIIIITL